MKPTTLDEKETFARALGNVALEFSLLNDAFPELIAAATDLIPGAMLARIARELVSERISLIPMPQLLNHLIIWESHRRRTGSVIGGENASQLRKTELRGGLRAHITKTLAPNNVLRVYLFDSALEERLRHVQSADSMADEELEHIRAAVREHVAQLPRTAIVPHILVSADVRSIVREILCVEFPRMAVLGYSDLAPDLNIQPVARVMVKAAGA